MIVFRTIHKMIATITRHQVGTVEKALKIFVDMGLIEILDNGAIYMLDIQQYIGESRTEADRKRSYRNKINNEKIGIGQMSGQMSDKRTPEIEIKLKKDLKIKKNINSMHEDKNIFMQLPLNTSELYSIYDDDIEEYKKLYPNVNIEQQIRNMKGWLDANPKKRKTKNGIKRFINSWLSREQDKPSIQHKPSKNNGTFTLSNGVETNNPFIAMIDESEEQ